MSIFNVDLYSDTYYSQFNFGLIIIELFTIDNYSTINL